MSVAYSPDGKQLASASGNCNDYKIIKAWDKTTKVWDAATGKLLHTLKGSSYGSGRSVVYSPDGKHLASGDSSQFIRIWDAAKGKLLRIVHGCAGTSCYSPHYNLAYSPNGKHLVSGSDDIKIWEVATGKLLNNLTDFKRNQFMAYSPDGKLLASG